MLSQIKQHFQLIGELSNGNQFDLNLFMVCCPNPSPTQLIGTEKVLYRGMGECYNISKNRLEHLALIMSYIHVVKLVIHYVLVCVKLVM